MEKVNHNSQKNISISRNDLPYQTLEALSASCLQQKEVSF
jgi:hypothetical protein